MKIDNPVVGQIERGLAETTKPKTPSESRTGGPSFSDMVEDAFNKVNKLQFEANRSVAEISTGGNASIHQTMIALEKATLSFQLMMQVRNKVVEAYREVMRMQV
ncbi:MAG: flagellar hook-basal body complex protein FliE [Deltaproteobacteria bacterium]|nr:flagellar hook-basal body complex protein FliE [Deltaproteobacteria bacterium]